MESSWIGSQAGGWTEIPSQSFLRSAGVWSWSAWHQRCDQSRDPSCEKCQYVIVHCLGSFCECSTSLTTISSPFSFRVQLRFVCCVDSTLRCTILDATTHSFHSLPFATHCGWFQFNSIPGVISHLPGGRAEMLIHVKLGVPSLNGNNESEGADSSSSTEPMPVDHLQVAKVFPYGKLLPLEVVPGGLSFHTGRVVEELGDTNDVGVCVAACVSLGYGTPKSDNPQDGLHKTFNTIDGYWCRIAACTLANSRLTEKSNWFDFQRRWTVYSHRWTELRKKTVLRLYIPL